MNGKQVKRLRREAMKQAIELMQSGKQVTREGYEVRTHSNHFSTASSILSSPAAIREAEAEEAKERRKPPSYQLLVRGDSLKGIYKKLKHGQ